MPRAVVRFTTSVVPAFLVLLALAPAALAGGSTAPGLWPKSKDIRHLRFEYGPIDVKPGQNDIKNVFLDKSAKPKVDGFIIRARPDLEYMDGSVPPVDVIHLHHGVWMNLSASSPAAPLLNIEPIFFGGEEKTVFKIPRGYGYPYKASDTWLLNHMIHNNTPNRTKVRLVWDLDFIPSTTALYKTVKPVKPLWMDVRRGHGYPVFDVLRDRGSNGRYTYPDQEATSPYPAGAPENEFTLPFGGTLVSAVGHLHPGGLYDDIDLIRAGATPPAAAACRTVARATKRAKAKRSCVKAKAGSVANSVRVFRSQAKYYDPAGPVSWDVSLTASRPDWRVKVNAGDVVRISSTYENKQAAWYENMGIVLLFMAVDDTSGVDPFAKAVDWRGELTHGHLAENNNHGGDRKSFVDARTLPDGGLTPVVNIKGFQFVPGDLGLLSDPGNGPGKVPVIQAGQPIEFVNQDDANITWHSITTCAAPCNRSTGISYPVANGDPAAQFDSGQLGFGQAGLSPAANTLTWKLPTTLKPGTYTYFCRVHSFMRGAFRVKPAGT